MPLLQATTRASGSLLASLKLQLSPLQLAEKDARGGWFGAVTVTDCDVLPVAPSSSVTVSRTVFVPPAPLACEDTSALESPRWPTRRLQASTRPAGWSSSSLKLCRTTRCPAQTGASA